MSDLGLKAATGTLYVQTGGDFVWQYEWHVDKVAAPFPAGSALDLIFGSSDVHGFTIAGDTAEIRIWVEVADLIVDRSPFRLRFTEPGELPTILVHGTVKRDDPKGLT